MELPYSLDIFIGDVRGRDFVVQDDAVSMKATPLFEDGRPEFVRL